MSTPVKTTTADQSLPAIAPPSNTASDSTQTAPTAMLATAPTADPVSLPLPSSTKAAEPAHTKTGKSSPASQTPPPIMKKMFKPTHPVVAQKDKSVHAEHGVIHYPWYFGGVSSCVAVLCTQPLGVGE